ncbi:hypothetical protein [Pseudoflavitalea rhizosphaerae]|uniref:hypothetical protein n=1 Tax=Pseudoflavitalea rhizosphaerae TaxID=1884793 RepID=UPI000F8C6CDF|nr:hypothetical protein [Pseudoflavitalea rhizosphaerae]
MKRIFFITSILLSAAVVQAQMPLGFGAMNGMQPGFRNFNQRIDTSHIQKKWFLTKYAGISAGLLSFNGGNSSFLSAPMGIQLNRSLSNNVLAFAGVTVAPTYFPGIAGYNMPFHTGFDKSNPFMNPNRFGTYSTAQMGLMYINNERTFSISGSIGVGRTDYYGRFPTYTPGHPSSTRNGKQ